jgi:hypothetical protein
VRRAPPSLGFAVTRSPTAPRVQHADRRCIRKTDDTLRGFACGAGDGLAASYGARWPWAAAGGFLLALEDAGWRCSGVDVDPGAVDAAHKAGLERVREGDFLEAGYPDSSMDAFS